MHCHQMNESIYCAHGQGSGPVGWDCLAGFRCCSFDCILVSCALVSICGSATKGILLRFTAFVGALHLPVPWGFVDPIPSTPSETNPELCMHCAHCPLAVPPNVPQCQLFHVSLSADVQRGPSRLLAKPWENSSSQPNVSV